MYKMYATLNYKNEIVFTDDQHCWCGVLCLLGEYKVHHVEMYDGEVESNLHGEPVTKELIRTLASNAAWDSGIDCDLLYEGVEVELLYCDRFPEKKPDLDQEIFETWMKR